MQKYTYKQGQYLAFVYFYIKLNKIAPAHADFQKYFQLDPASVNSMLKTLERKEFIKKEKGVACSIQLLIAKEDLPELD